MFVETSDAYGRMESAFPFLPDLIDLVFERITVSGGFQGTRAALGLPGAMVDAAPASLGQPRAPARGAFGPHP